MKVEHRRLLIPFVIGVLAVFLSVSFAGAVVMDAGAGPGGMMLSNCPFMPGMSAVCQMDPHEHIAAWQSLFAAIANQLDTSTMLLMLAALLLFAAFFVFQGVLSALRSAVALVPVYRASHIAFLDPLKEALASGIIHPKVYE